VIQLLLNTNQTTALEKKISVEGIQLENVERFTCLVSNATYDLDCKKDISV